MRQLKAASVLSLRLKTLGHVCRVASNERFLDYPRLVHATVWTQVRRRNADVEGIWAAARFSAAAGSSTILTVTDLRSAKYPYFRP